MSNLLSSECKIPEQKNELSATIIIPGFSGDLSKRKLIPALYALTQKGFKGVIIGTGRKDVNVDDVWGAARSFINNYDEKTGKVLRDMLFYVKANPEKPEDYNALYDFILTHEKNMTAKRLVFMSTPADSFCQLTQRFVNSGIIEHHNAMHRIAYEKPFGSDTKSARDINRCILEFLSPAQIFRIDHYLAKSIVMALPSLISSNIILQNSWDANSIAAVNIFFDEHVGIEGRGSFYDRYGALKDVVQNHILQLCALVGAAGNTDPMVKAEFIRSLSVKSGVLGQYENYLKEADVAPNSKTETYAALTLQSSLKHWKDVPFNIQTGKSLGHKLSEIQVIFKSSESNAPVLTIQIAPKEEITLKLSTEQMPKVLTSKEAKFPDAYETLLHTILMGKHNADASTQEIEAQWELLDKVHKLNLPLKIYKQGSSGPI